jgi:hypothetical protein
MLFVLSAHVVFLQRLLERLARAIFCSGRWSQRSEVRKNS